MKILCLMMYLVGGWRLLLLLLAAMVVAIAQHRLAPTSAPAQKEASITLGASWRPPPPGIR